MEKLETLSAAQALSPIFSFWDALSKLFQSWILSPGPFQELQSRFSFFLAIGFLAFGVFATLFGGRKVPYRIIAILPGLLMGWYLGGFLAALTGISPMFLAYGLALFLATLGGYRPNVLAALGFAIIGGIFGYELSVPDNPGNENYETLVRIAMIFGGALLVGFIAFLLERVTTAMTSSAIGALCFVLGFTALLRILGVNFPFMQSPYFLQIALGIVFAIGLFTQYRYISTEEERQAERIEKAREKARVKEERERNKRFEAYGKKASGK